MVEDFARDDLHLSIIFDYYTDVLDKSLVAKMLEPIRRSGCVKSCAVLLDGDIKPDESKLARDSAKSFVESRPESFSQFMELPVEIQAEVIAYASLTSSRSTAPNYASDHGLGTGTVLWNFNKGLAGYSKSRCCGTCSPSHTVESIQTLDIAAQFELPCFCSKTASAYSTTCICFDIPTHLFVVSRQFGRVAQEMFYRNNTFVVTGTRIKGMSECHAKDAISDFGVALPRQQISSIRKLHLRFNIYDAYHSSLQLHKMYTLPYLARVCQSVSESFDMQKLTLTLDFTPPGVAMTTLHQHTRLPVLRSDNPRRTSAADWQDKGMILYKRIGRVVAEALAPPKHLWYYLAWPLSPRDEERQELEHSLERMVMGDDYYSSMTDKPVFDLCKESSVHKNHAFCIPGGCIPGYFPDPRQEIWYVDGEPYEDDQYIISAH